MTSNNPGYRSVLFLGAGASAAFGLPTVTRFFAHLTHHNLWMEPGQPIGLQRCVDDIARRLSIVRGDPRYDFNSFDAELLFAALENMAATARLYTDDGLSSDLLVSEQLSPTTILARMKERIVTVYAHDVTQDTHHILDAYMGVLEPLDRAACLSTPLDVFTTNYDSIAEQVFRILPATRLHSHPTLGSAQMADGFLNTPGARAWSPDAAYKQAGIRVYKLHGSVTWKWRGTPGTIVPVDIGISDPNVRSDCLLYFGYKSVPVEDPFLYLHDRLRDTLLQPCVVVVIGFRMADPYICSLFDNCLQSNARLRVVFINPDDPPPPALSRLMQSHTDSTRYVRAKFGDPRVSELLTGAVAPLLA